MKLKELGEYYIGLTYKPEDVTDGGTIVLRSGNIQEGKFDLSDIVRVNTKIRDKLYVRPGDVLMCSRNGSARLVGKATVIPELEEPMTFGAFMTIFRTPYNDYLRYFLQSNDFRRQLSSSKTTTINQITINMLDNIDIELPEESIREERCKKLELIQCVIDERKKELDMLDELIKARFVELFGDPEINPMKWPEQPLSERLDVLGGYAFKSENFDEESGIPVLRIGNVNSGHFKSVNMVYWTEDASLERYAIYPGDLVMSLTGTVGKDDYGNVCILGSDYNKYYLNQRNAKLEIKEGLDKYYLSQLLKFDSIKKRLTGISRGVRQANIANKDILNLIVPIPPIGLQKSYSEFVEQVDKSKVFVKKALDESQLLFDSLMQEYFG